MVGVLCAGLVNGPVDLKCLKKLKRVLAAYTFALVVVINCVLVLLNLFWDFAHGVQCMISGSLYSEDCKNY
jgi:hypothetical protein